MAFCHTCQRGVYLQKDQDPYCPVCSGVLVNDGRNAEDELVPAIEIRPADQAVAEPA